jgi:hypothetical protein
VELTPNHKCNWNADYNACKPHETCLDTAFHDALPSEEPIHATSLYPMLNTVSISTFNSVECLRKADSYRYFGKASLPDVKSQPSQIAQTEYPIMTSIAPV